MNKIFKVLCGCLVGCAFGSAITSCSDDFEPSYLGEVRVSSSYVAIPQAGGSATITVNAASDWSIASQEWIQGKDTITAAVPQWLTVSATEGAAGSAEITFSAEATDAARECEVWLTCAGKTQRINVLQYAEDSEPTLMTVQEALALLKSGTAGDAAYYIKGVVCKIQEISPSYGNATYFLSDDGAYVTDKWLEIYRGKWINGESFATGNEFSVGDEMVVKGVLTMYGDTPETKQGTCEVISHTPSLIKVDSFDVAELPVEGGVATAAVTCKGNGINVEVPAAAQSWLSIIGVDTSKGAVKFSAAPNMGGDRSTSIVFKTTDATGKEYSAEATLSQKGSILEVSVAQFLAAEVGDTQYRMTGVITELYNTSKGLAGFYVKDYSGQALVYQPAGFSGTEAKVGDVVTVVGKRGAYNNNPQMTGCTLEKVNYSVTEVSIAEFLTKADDKNTYYMVTGTIKSLKNNKGQDNDYGNLYLTDGTNEIYVYGTYSGWAAPKGDAQKYFIRDNGLEVGDELTMIGYKDTYNGLIEICGGTCFSFKKVQAAGAAGSKENPFTIAEAFAYIDAGGQDDVYVKGKVSKIQNEFTADNGYGTFWISEDGTYNNDLTKDFEAYRVYWFGDNKKWKEGDSQPAVGDEVIICGKLTKYTNKNTGAVTYETSQYKAYVYSLNGKTE